MALSGAYVVTSAVLGVATAPGLLHLRCQDCPGVFIVSLLRQFLNQSGNPSRTIIFQSVDDCQCPHASGLILSHRLAQLCRITV